MPPAIDVRSVSKRYGRFTALDDVSLSIPQGEFFGLLGPNGAGKTTLISIVAGLVRASEGAVAVLGHDVRRDFRQARRALGVVPQELVFDPFFSVRETLRITSGYYGVRDNARRMAALGYNVVWHRILAYGFAAVIASFGGILLVWQNAQIAPGTAGIPAVIDILVIAVVGGLRHPIGPFIGAFIYVLLSSFAPDALQAFGLGPDRFKLVVGLGFLAIVYFSPDGVLGLWSRAMARRREKRDPLTGQPR